MVKDKYAGMNSSDMSVEELPVIAESLVEKKTTGDANKISGKKYGYDFFSSMPTSLTAVGDLPLPNDYKISLRDQFSIILSGQKKEIFNLGVKLDGTILFPELGTISVAGLSLQEVKDKLSQLIELSYIGVNIDVSIQNLSAKKITIVGAVETPGTYLVNPFSTIAGALAYSGGISEIGSLRDIKLIRNNKEVFSFDLYDLLIMGDRSNDHNIEAGDTLLINAASQFVEISGAVKRPGIYEILEGETLEDIVNFALGFTQTANQSNISISLLNLSEAKIVKRNTNNLDQGLKNALSINVFNYLNEGTSNIQVLGAIEQPGFYDVQKYKNLEDLVANLKFIDVYPWLAVLEQFDENNLIKSSILFSLNDPGTYNSLELLPNSRVYFTNIDDRSFDVSEITRNKIADYKLVLNHKQGTFELPVYGSYSVSSFIDLLGLDMSDVDNTATYVSPLDDIIINDNYKNMQFTAKKYNTVSFRSPDNNLISVSISGAVDFPGTYVLKDNSTIQDLYQLVGSFKSQAHLEGIILTREVIREKQIKAIQLAKKNLDKAVLNFSQKGNDIVDMSIIQALSQKIEPANLGRLAGDFSPKSRASINTILFDGDTIIVPKNSNTINVLGEVLNPISFEYSKKIRISSAINNAGGYQKYADKKRVYVIKANGLIERRNRTLFIFRRNINLEPGDTIVVSRRVIASSPVMELLLPITQILSDFAFGASAIESLKNN
jgi:protein involved in polysaccharide export with SLBB domain|tara:strand:- start:361 stop:2523 length:2163 start_codon:yes stop_codon:yes gene_type:complete